MIILTGASKSTQEIVHRSFYVDDCLHSMSSTAEARETVMELTNLLKSGGFELTKFASNFPEILDIIPEKDRSSSSQKVNCDSNPTQRTLGINWNTLTDKFEIYVNLNERPATRRGMLSQIGQVFDPLGFLQPFLLPGKLILQDLCHEGYEWDKEVTGSRRSSWEGWISSLSRLNGLSIPRCHKSKDFKPVRIELHCFSDASENGYGTVAYFRFVNDKGVAETSFVRGSSRVAPKRFISIPRLELMSAVLATELAKSILAETNLKIDRTFYWSDSMSVLKSINSQSCRFKTFVANRVAMIRSASEACQWHYVPTELNSADIASRGLTTDETGKTDVWLYGPAFLKSSKEAWPSLCTEKISRFCDPTFQREIKVNVVRFENLVSSSSSGLDDLLSRHSIFERLQRSVAWLL